MVGRALSDVGYSFVFVLCSFCLELNANDIELHTRVRMLKVHSPLFDLGERAACADRPPVIARACAQPL